MFHLTDQAPVRDFTRVLTKMMPLASRRKLEPVVFDTSEMSKSLWLSITLQNIFDIVTALSSIYFILPGHAPSFSVTFSHLVWIRDKLEMHILSKESPADLTNLLNGPGWV